MKYSNELRYICNVYAFSTACKALSEFTLHVCMSSDVNEKTPTAAQRLSVW